MTVGEGVVTDDFLDREAVGGEERGRAQQDARAAAKLVTELSPSFQVGAYRNVQPFRDPENWQRLSKALLAAGIPE